MFDITERKHGGNEASKDAFAVSVNHHQNDRKRILDFIESRYMGVTSKEIGEWLNKPLNCFSGRITELRLMELIKECGRRGGCTIWVSVKPQGRLL